MSSFGAKSTHPYDSLERKGAYIYEVLFSTIPPDSDSDSVPGMCSSYVKDGKLFRLLDWNYDETASFRIFCPDFEGMSFINGLTDTELDDELIGQLPYHVVDGVNGYGIMVSTHVLYNDWDIHGSGEIPLTKLPYTALTRIKSMATIEADLAGVLDNLHTTPSMDAAGYLIQVLVSDGATTYVLRPNTEAAGEYEAINITENPKLTNFLWVNAVLVDRTELQNRPTGVERWNTIPPAELSDLRFTKAYEAPTRLSEFIGIRETTKDSTDEELTEIYTNAHALYERRSRDGTLWHTMHSVVYEPYGMVHLWVQENWARDYVNSVGMGESGIEALFNHICNITHILEASTSPGYSLPTAPTFSYPTQPDETAIRCHFNIKGGSPSLIQKEPENELTDRVKLNLPVGTDIRLHDKVVDCDTGLEYTAVSPPRNIRGNHIIVYVERTRTQKPL